MQIKAKADKEGFDLCIGLSIIDSGEIAVKQLSTGVIRIRGDNSQELTEREVSLQPILAQFRKGSQLRLSISGSSWPAVAINPGSSRHECGPTNSKCQITTISIDLNQAKLLIDSYFPT